MLRWSLSVLLILILVACTPNNAPLGPEQFDAVGPPVTEIEVAREGVFLLQGDERQSLSAAEQVTLLEAEQGLAVDDSGRAILRFNDRLTLELLRGAELPQIQQAVSGTDSTVGVALNGGTLVADLTISPETENNLTVQTAFGTITGSNARFAVVREANSPLEWVLALEVPEDGSLAVMSGSATRPIAGGQARWISSTGEPSQAIVIDQNAQEWLENARNNLEQPELGAVLLPPANILADTGQLAAAPAPGRRVEFGRDVQGAVQMTADPVGIFGDPTYTLEDCNSDGVSDLAVRNGMLYFDFAELQARVRALDVTLLNRAAPGDGLLQAFDPAGMPVVQQRLAAAGDTETLSLRSEQPYLSAKLTLADACLVGISLTPPGAEPTTPPPVRPVTESLPASDAVVNVLQSSAERLPQNGQFQAPRVGAGGVNIDGALTDWEALSQQSGVEGALFAAIAYDDGCGNRFPGGETLLDLSGQVYFAYDDQNFYVAFLVNDDGVVPYTGSDYRYFLGDSPQLLLDLDLTGDFEAAALSGDDVQVDLLPLGQAPQAALWRLSTLTSGLLSGARVAAAPIDGGYVVEAALPWASLGASPRPGDRLGIVANISDNDTPDANTQECIITTAPQRDWRNPTTWGTVLLLPTPAE